MNLGNVNLNVDTYEVKNKLFQLHAMVKGYPEIKTKVKAATNLDPWGPTQAQMQEICDACHNYEDRRLVMRALWKRITTSNQKEWPHVYKALAIIEYLLLHGPESLEDEIRDQLSTLKALHDFQATDEKGQDKGFAIREKSKKIVAWLSQDRVLTEERNKTAALQSKYIGISSVGGPSAPSGSAASPSFSAARNPAPRTQSPIDASPPVTRTSPLAPVRAPADDSFGEEADTDALDAAPPLEFDAQPEDLFGASPFDPPPAASPAPAPSAPAAAKPKPKPKGTAPKAPASRPAPPAPVAGAFDPFGAAPKPAAPKPAADLSDFFAPVQSAAAFDPFSAPLPPPPARAPAPAAAAPQDDLFAPSAQADLFGSVDPFATANPFDSAASPSAGAEKKTLFQDATFDQLCSLDRLGGPPAPAAGAPMGFGDVKGPTQSLKAMKAQQAMKSPQAASSADSYNPFL